MKDDDNCNPLGEIIHKALTTGEPQCLNKEEARRLRNQLAAKIGLELEKFRDEQRRAEANEFNDRYKRQPLGCSV